MGLLLLGGVRANAADAPEADQPPPQQRVVAAGFPAVGFTTEVTTPVPTPAAPAPTTATTTSSTTTTTAPPPPSTTTTTAPPPPPPGSSVDEAIRYWFGDVEAKARDVAWCESRHDPRAVSSGGGNHGLFQINNVHAEQFPAVTGVSWEDGRYDAFHNAHFARWLYERQGWSPWACA